MPKIKLSRDQWEKIGKNNNWFKSAQTSFSEANEPDPILESLREPDSAWNKLSTGSAEDLKQMAESEFTPFGILQDIINNPRCTPEIKEIVEKNPNYKS